MGGGVGSLNITLFWRKKAFGSVYINYNYFVPLSPISFKQQTTQVFRTNTYYYQWDKARKAWGINANISHDFIQIATVWLAPKQEYDVAISNIDPRWMGDTVMDRERY